jgi:SAM-dependent methyltransferase
VLLPEQLVGLLPGQVEQRVKAIRTWQAEKKFLAPDTASPLDNVAYNRSLWNWYADKWSDLDFRQRQLAYEGRQDEDPASVDRLGEEWGRLDDVRQVVDKWILPHVGSDSVVGEIGTGGGRVARMVAPSVKEFHAFDVAPRMLERARTELMSVAGAQFHVLDSPALPEDLGARFDFIYSFDVFVHLDLHVQWHYLREFARVLRPGGRAFIHTANLTAEAGWDRFVAQDGYRVEGFYFMVPEAVRTLIARSGLRIVDEVSGEPGNFYYERDYLALLEKPSG